MSSAIRIFFIAVVVVLISGLLSMTSCKDRVKTADNIIKPTQDAKASSMTETTENVNTTQTVMPTSESTASNENLQIPVTSETQENDVLISPIAILTADYKYSNIFLADSDGKLIRKITENNFNNFAPELAPAGDKIAFYSDMDGDFDIYTVNTDGTDLKNITDNKSQDYMPKWSKDGRKICYYSDEPGNTDIYIINIDGTQNQQIVKNNSENYGAIWSKDYSEIFYVSNEAGSFDIYSIGIDGSQKIKLTDDEYFEESLSLSQDGNKILYSSGQIDNTVFEVHSFDLNSLESHQLTNNMSYGRMPLWVQGGEKIIFSSDMEGYSEIYMMKVDGKGVINLTNNGIDDYLIDVSKDGLNVFYEAFKEDGKAELLMYDLKSSRTVLIMEIDPEAHYN